MEKAAPALLQRGRVYFKKGDLEKAARDFEEVSAINPNWSAGYIGRAVIYNQKKEHAKARAELDSISKLKAPKPGSALNSLAWIRATASDAELRDGNKATEEALQACSDSQWQEWSYIDTLAAAFAEAGKFDQAVRYEEQALGVLVSGDWHREKIESRLALYRDHKPYREDPFDH